MSIYTGQTKGSDDWVMTSGGLIIPEYAKPKPRPTGIDLFCGAGGFSCGFIQAGWHVIAGFDNEAEAAWTYMVNLGGYPIDIHFATPEDKERLNKRIEKTYGMSGKARKKKIVDGSWTTSGSGWIAGTDYPGVNHFFFGDIRAWTGRQVLDILGMKEGEIGCVFGGPPCQGFSTAGKRNVMDPRNSLVFEFCRLTLELRPATLCLENVPGIVSMVTPEGLPVVDAICMMLEQGEYGTFDALKKSLLLSSGSGAALQTSKRGRPKDKDDEKEVETRVAQTSLPLD